MGNEPEVLLDVLLPDPASGDVLLHEVVIVGRIVVTHVAREGGVTALPARRECDRGPEVGLTVEDSFRVVVERPVAEVSEAPL